MACIYHSPPESDPQHRPRSRVLGPTADPGGRGRHTAVQVRVCKRNEKGAGSNAGRIDANVAWALLKGAGGPDSPNASAAWCVAVRLVGCTASAEAHCRRLSSVAAGSHLHHRLGPIPPTHLPQCTAAHAFKLPGAAPQRPCKPTRANNHPRCISRHYHMPAPLLPHLVGPAARPPASKAPPGADCIVGHMGGVGA